MWRSRVFVAIMTRYITYVLLLTSFTSFGQVKHPKKKSKTPTVLLDSNHGKDLYEYFTILDTNYLKYKLPDTFSKPAKWLENEKERNGEFRIDYFSPYPDSFKLLTALSYIDTAKEFDKVCKAKSWCIDNFKTCFPLLVARLSYKEKIGLINTADLIIGDRMSTGDLAFYGHGGFVNEDLFTIAGRASWILNDLTGEEFASVHGRLTKEEAENYKALWIKYIQTLKGQTLSDTINSLKDYSHNYLELLFNKRDIDSRIVGCGLGGSCIIRLKTKVE